MIAFRSRLFWKAFLSILLGLLLWLPVFYWLTVPLVNRLAEEMEERSGRTVLDNVVQMVSESERNMQAWRQSAVEAHKRELKNIVLLVESWTRQKEAEVAAGQITRAQARQLILERVRKFRYGNNDYVWAADYDSVLVSHPDPEFHGKVASVLRDTKGNLVVPPMVEAARKAGEGYSSYWWRRLETGRQVEKLSYFRDFPQWRLVVGTGVYVDDVEQEVARRREAELQSLRRHLHRVKVARSGYVFVIDGRMNVIVHPDSRLENGSMAGLKDAATGRPLAEEFIAAAGRPDQTARYQWNRPDDMDHYSYPKVAWVRHVPELDWYIGATVYEDDLRESGRELAQRILLAFMLGLAITALAALVFIRSLTAPILRLATLARRNQEGELTPAGDETRRDEIGVLARAFNHMVARVKDQIDNLETRVEERTREISVWAAQLEQRNREIAAIDGAIQSFQACEDVQEVNRVLRRSVAALFPGFEAAILLLRDIWEHSAGIERQHWLKQGADCRAVRKSALHRVDVAGTVELCDHLPDREGPPHLCMPLAVRGTLFGILHIKQGSTPDSPPWDPARVERVAHALGGQVALTLANLRLRDTLRQQSIRDPLTQLYNRRFLHEYLAREEPRVRQDGGSLGLILLDIDLFKRINDDYGHETGDLVLRALSRLLSGAVRGGDIACRFGGEEFLLVLPGASLGLCRQRAEDLRHRVTTLRVPGKTEEIRITLSAGVAAFPESGDSVANVIGAADAALYQAKRQGRNRVVEAPACAAAAVEMQPAD